MASSRSIEAGKAHISLSMKDADLQSRLKSLNKSFAATGAQLQRLGRAGIAAGAAITGAFVGAAKVFADAGDQIDKMSKRTGASAEFLSAIGFAAGQSGTNIEGLEKAFKGMSNSLSDANDGLETATLAYAKLGLSAADLQGLAPEDQFLKVASALSKITDVSRQGAIAQDIFGRSGRDLLPLFQEGTEGLSAYIAEAKRLGIVMSTDQATSAAELTDAMGRLSAQVKAVAINVGSAVAGEFTMWLGKTEEILASVIRWVQANGELIVSVLKLGVEIAAVGTAIAVAGTGVVGLSFALTAITTPIGLAAVAAGGLAIAFAAMTADSITSFDDLEAAVIAAVASISKSLINLRFMSSGEWLFRGDEWKRKLAEVDAWEKDFDKRRDERALKRARQSAVEKRGPMVSLGGSAAFGTNPAFVSESIMQAMKAAVNSGGASAIGTSAAFMSQGIMQALAALKAGAKDAGRAPYGDARGTFSGAEAALLGRGQGLAERTAKAAERTADATEKMERAFDLTIK